MFQNILFLCFLAPALGGFRHPDISIYPDHQYRRQLGNTRDDRAPPLNRNAPNTRRYHRPILRNEIPVLSKHYPVLPLSPELDIKTLKFLPVYVKKNYRTVLRGNVYLGGRENDWIRVENKPVKRERIEQNDLEDADDGSKDTETRDDQNVDINKSNEDAEENNHLPKAEEENKIDEPNSNLDTSGELSGNGLEEHLGLLKSQEIDTVNNEPEGPSQDNISPQPEAFGDHTSQSRSQKYDSPEILNLGYNSPESQKINWALDQDEDNSETQNRDEVILSQTLESKSVQSQSQELNTPQGLKFIASYDQNPGNNELPKEIPLKIPSQFPGYGYNSPQSQQDYNSPQSQGLNQPQGQPHYNPQDQIYPTKGLNRPYQLPIIPQSLDKNLDYTLYQSKGYTPQAVGVNSNFGPNAYQGGQGYKTQPLVGYNAYQGVHDYNPPQSPLPNLVSTPYVPVNLLSDARPVLTSYKGVRQDQGLGNSPDLDQGVGPDYNPPDGPGSGPHGLGNAPTGPGYPPPDMPVTNTYQTVTQNNNPQGLGSAPNIPLPNVYQNYNMYPSQNQNGYQGQINPNQIQNNCQQPGQCYPNDSVEVRRKMLQLIRDTKLSIDQKVMPISEVHMAFKPQSLYKIGYLVSSINRTHDSVVDFYKYVEQNAYSWEFMKILQAYEQVKLADAFLTDVLYTLNQLAANNNSHDFDALSMISLMRSGKSSEETLDRNTNTPKEYDEDLDWLYYDDA